MWATVYFRNRLTYYDLYLRRIYRANRLWVRAKRLFVRANRLPVRAKWFLANGISDETTVNRGRFPFNKNHRFKFSEFSLVEWNPRTLGHVPATQGMLGETFLFDNGGLFEHFRGFRAGRTILDRNDDVILLAAVACFMRKELTLVNGHFEVTIPAYLSGEFENHFRMTG